jgi:putative peptide zinc metalloprotease protein
MLPPLREELSLHPGPPASNGASTWSLHDPVRNRFFRLDWPGFEMLARWSLGDAAAVIAVVNSQTTLTVDEDDVADLLRFLTVNQLVRPITRNAFAGLVAAARAQKHSPFQWLLHHYLFFRIPLVRPDRFLAATCDKVRWASSRTFLSLTLVALALGLFLVHRQWDQFRSTLVDMMPPAGLAGYGAALIAAKVIHELAHAYAAKRLGCRVPTMGIAFLVMCPVLYTDVNEAWKLPRRRDRLMVGAAGILAELTLAAWSTTLWAFLPEGPLRQAAFMLCTTTWISTLAINLSPFMRFDGYFLLMDGLDMPNLHSRAFAMARWWLREFLFDLGEPSPEQFSQTAIRRLVAFAFAVWVYRLSLFLGIAALVYHFFIKVVGIGLFAVEIGWFVILPVAMEIKEWRQYKAEIITSRRSRWTMAALGAGILLTVVPWHSHVAAPALLKASRTAGLYAPMGAKLLEIRASRSQTVSAGQTVFVLASPDLDGQEARVSARLTSLHYQIEATSFDPTFREQSLALDQELAAERAESLGIAAQKNRLTVTAPFDGLVTDILPDLHPGDWISPKDRLATIKAVADDAVVEAYVEEDDLARLSEGDPAIFLPEGSGWDSRPCRIVSIDRTPVLILADPEIAKPYGGGIAVRGKETALVPDGAVYRVHISGGSTPVPAQLRGTVHIMGRAESLILRASRAAIAVILRECGA